MSIFQEMVCYRQGDRQVALLPITHLFTMFNDTQNPVEMVRHDHKFPRYNIPSHFGGFYPFGLDNTAVFICNHLIINIFAEETFSFMNTYGDEVNVSHAYLTHSAHLRHVTALHNQHKMAAQVFIGLCDAKPLGHSTLRFVNITVPGSLLLAVVPGDADTACQSAIQQRETDNAHDNCGCFHSFLPLIMQYHCLRRFLF
jgi:hypothetical protein